MSVFFTKVVDLPFVEVVSSHLKHNQYTVLEIRFTEEYNPYSQYGLPSKDLTIRAVAFMVIAKTKDYLQYLPLFPSQEKCAKLIKELNVKGYQRV